MKSTTKQIYVEEGYLIALNEVELNGFTNLEKIKYRVDLETGLLVEIKESGYVPPIVHKTKVTTSLKTVRVPPYQKEENAALVPNSPNA